MTLRNHLLGATSFAFVTCNLLLWLPMLAMLALINAIFASKAVATSTSWIVDSIYRAAVKADTWWLTRVVGIIIEVEDASNSLDQLAWRDNSVIISNHQSWFDIFILQALITQQGPIIKFLVKKELLWVPVVGWICLVLNFPAMIRRGDQQSHSQDLRAVELASSNLDQEPGALLIFPEGSRFTEHRRQSLASNYKHLLKPKQGGFSIVQQSVASDTQILDVSICYENHFSSCWRFMGGALNKIRVRVDSYKMSDVTNSTDWLERRWQDKDQWLTSA